MRRIMSGVVGLGVVVIMTLLVGAHGSVGGQEATARRNPTMYDVYLVSAASDVAGKVGIS